MFSFLWNGSKKGASTSSTLPSHRSSSSRPDPASIWSADADYDDVAFGDTSEPGSEPYDGVTPVLRGPSILGSRDHFVEGRPVSNDPQASYPPLPSFSQPSSTKSRDPPLRRTFRHLEDLLADRSPALLDSLADPIVAATDPQLVSLLQLIAPYRLPPAVIEAYTLHDGQDPFALGGMSDGLIWGLRWMPLEEVEREWKAWRQLEAAGGLSHADSFGTFKDDPSNVSQGRGREHPYVEENPDAKPFSGREEGRADAGMSSFPNGWVRSRYSHPGWLPLLTDRCGNYIGVDLDPPPPPPRSSTASTSRVPGLAARGYGQPGQVIAFGREIDQKVVLFPGDGSGGWARFLAAFVEDVERGEFAVLDHPSGRGNSNTKANGWRKPNSDVEQGSGDQSPRSDDGWDEGDGIGDRGYLEGHSYGEEAEDSGGVGSEARNWVLRSEYRRLIAIVPGGLIGLIAERSRRKWRSLGVGSRNTSSTDAQSTKGKPPLAIIVPDTTEAGPESSTTVRASSPTTNGKNALSPPPVEVVLSPPSPIKSVSFNDEGENASLPDEPGSSTSSSTIPFKSARAQSKSPDHLNDGRSQRSSPSSSRSSRRMTPNRKNRPPPPPPAALDLPTRFDLLSVEDREPVQDSVSIAMDIGASPTTADFHAEEHEIEHVYTDLHGPDDPRDSTSSLRPEHSRSNSREEAVLRGLAVDSQVDLHEGDVMG
ncbi:BQ5605_C034g11311 [Microbotryum silenes-dioicae]|uniref:BQ5605_C034g11311 protein n=1 Tax=Microbotryum silenes-dioicae TaxID=796604 RepID=A0A2X0MGJ5_9BASI|nr:BQ5605_C034g11311 [Microbotryum silenes-dioicae]